MIWFVALLAVLTTTITVVAFFSARRSPVLEPAKLDDGKLFFVFVIPCLNEELVIAATLERLLQLPEHNSAILVIDDASSDNTAEIVKRHLSDRVWLLRRRLPNAQQGKGAALNAAYRFLLASPRLRGRPQHNVIFSVFDADGRIDADTLDKVQPYFNEPRTAAVQIGVRMYNAKTNLLARMQDVEFSTFTEIFQRSRDRGGSAGLGGNGQFVRLSALRSLGDAPWTHCLTEDLDLGIRLLLKGWRNRYCRSAYVSQQAVTDVKRLIRQRARWFQGHLQCWRLVPRLLESPHVSSKTANNALYHLAGPALVLLMTLPVISFVVALTAMLVTDAAATGETLLRERGRFLAVGYLLMFGLSGVFAVAYRRVDGSTSWPRALLYGHAYCIYGYLWFVAGWIAVFHYLQGRKGWAKTARSVDDPEEPAQPQPASAAPALVPAEAIPSTAPAPAPAAAAAAVSVA